MNNDSISIFQRPITKPRGSNCILHTFHSFMLVQMDIFYLHWLMQIAESN